MNEVSVVFGSDRHPAGTLTLPVATTAQPVAFLLLNAGVIHRIGPNRINVKLARQLDAFRGHRLVDAVRCDFAPHIDHTITSIALQDQLISAICDWATGLRAAAR